MQEPNYTVIEDLFKSILETLKRKNHDYDNAFAKACDEFGNMYAVSKIYEKYSRIRKLSETANLVASESLSDALIDIIGYASLLYERLNPGVLQGNWLFRNAIFEIDPVTEDIKYTDGRLVIKSESVKAMCMNPTLTTEVYVMEQSEVKPFEAILRSLVMRHQCEYDFPNLKINVCNNGTTET